MKSSESSTVTHPESVSVSDRYISIFSEGNKVCGEGHNPTVIIPAGSTRTFYAVFLPITNYATFKVPLVFDLAGAKTTLGELKMRAVKPTDEEIEETKNDIKKKECKTDK